MAPQTDVEAPQHLDWFVPILKYTEDPDGSIYVEGIATNDTLDLDNQIIDRDFARKAMTDWFADWGNVRQMHNPGLPPAGKAVALEERPEGFWVRVKVINADAIKLVKEKVYQAFSIGLNKVRIIADAVAQKGRVVDGIQSELSLVDFPANPTTRFMIAKRAATGVIETVEKMVAPQLVKAHTVNITVDLDGGDARMSPGDVALVLQKVGKANGAVRPESAKRDFDPNTGGGVDRDKLPASDFVFPDERVFPIVTAGDVPDAVSSWGRYKGKHSFAEFKSRLTALANRKGFGAKLPDEWKDNDTSKTTGPELAATTEPDVAKGGRDCTNCDAKYHTDHKGNFCSNCGHKLPAGGDGDGGDGKAAEPEVEKRKDAQPGLEQHREPDGDEKGPDVDGDGDGGKPVAKSVTPPPYHLARLHDATCAAYHDTDVLVAHPALAKGIPSTVDASLWAADVTKALTDDGGTGTRMHELPGLSAAYGFAVQIQKSDPELLDSAMVELRKSFADMNPTAHPTPTDIQPGQFQRPYISAGRAPLSSTGASPRIPFASNVPDASQFQRPLITDGHQAASPGSNPAPKAADADLVKRTYYSNAAREQAGGVLTAMHDYIADMHPGVCPMAGEMQATPAPEGGTPTVAGLDTRATSTPMPAHPAAPSTVTKGAAVDPDLLRHLVDEATAELRGQVDELRATLTKRVSDLEASPDPQEGAYRGSSILAALRPGATQTLAGQGDADAVEKVVRLVKRAKDANSEVSRPAIEQLFGMYGADGVAKLLS